MAAQRRTELGGQVEAPRVRRVFPRHSEIMDYSVAA
jgi:hypothetical protein